MGRTIFVKDAQARIIGGDLKVPSQRDHSSIYFDDSQARGGQMAMTKLGQ